MTKLVVEQLTINLDQSRFSRNKNRTEDKPKQEAGPKDLLVKRADETQASLGIKPGQTDSLIEEKINNYIEALKSEDKDVRQEAVWALEDLAEANISPEVKELMVEPLVQALKDESEIVRWGATLALGNLAQSNISLQAKTLLIVGPLIQALKDEDEDVRWGATLALNNAAKSDIPPEAKALMVGPLIQVLKDENKDIVWGAILALGNLAQSDIALEVKILMRDALFEVLDKQMKYRYKHRDESILNESASVLNKLAETLADAKKYQEAINFITYFLAQYAGIKTTSRLQALLIFAQIYNSDWEERDIKRAEDYFDTIFLHYYYTFKENPNTCDTQEKLLLANACLGLAKIFQEKGEIKQARAYCNCARAVLDNIPEEKAATKAAKLEAERHLTKMLLSLGQHQKASDPARISAWAKVARPAVIMRGGYAAAPKTDNPLDRSIAETQSRDYFDIGLRVDPSYRIGDDNTHLDINGAAGFMHETGKGNSDTVLRLTPEVRLGALIFGAEAGLEYTTLGTENPSIAFPYDSMLSGTFGGYAGFAIGQTFKLYGFYRYITERNQYKKEVLDTAFTEKAETHEIGATAQVTSRVVDGKLTISGRSGTQDRPNSSPEKSRKKETGGVLVEGQLQIPAWARAYIAGGYAQENNGGTETLKHSQVRLGARFGQLPIEAAYDYYENNIHKPSKYQQVSLRFAPFIPVIVEGFYQNLNGENGGGVFVDIAPLLNFIPFFKDIVRDPYKEFLNRPFRYPSDFYLENGGIDNYGQH